MGHGGNVHKNHVLSPQAEHVVLYTCQHQQLLLCVLQSFLACQGHAHALLLV